MRALQAYIQQYNDWDVKFFKAKPLDLNSASDRQRIADMIDSALSPENLSCDGELPMREVRSRYNKLTAAARDLQKLDPNVKFYEFA
jgi:hypothetical protein